MTTYNKNDPQTIQAMFGSIAKQYDRTNAVLSFQLHKLWNKRLIQSVMKGQNPASVLDLCCGTGEIAFTYLKGCSQPKDAYLIDFCSEMLDCAREKAKRLNMPKHQISYIQGDAQAIPLPDLSVNCATIAYGIRNVKNPFQCIQEVYRVLQPGGTFGILELTQPENHFLKLGHTSYLKMVLPILGKFLTSNQDAYEYLCNSIHTFIKPQTLKELLCNAGFENVQTIPLCGGIATIIQGQKALLNN